MRVLVFGASSAQGYWDSQGGWADRLKDYYNELQMRDFSVELPKVMNLGISGDTTTNILNRIDSESRARQNEKGLSFVFQIGTNNAAEEKGKMRFSVEDYKSDLKKLIEIARKYSDKIMVVGFPAVDESLTNPIAWSDIYFKNKNIKMIERAAGEVSQAEGVSFAPIHQKFIELSEAGTTLQAHDGLHPNDAGHQLIFELVRPALDQLLNT
jgi:lysophospholipase L1-like esterase